MHWPLVLLILLGFASAAHGQQAEDWAWEQIRVGKIADFNSQLGMLDPTSGAFCGDSRRRISAQFLQNVLTDPKRQTELLHHRVWLSGACIVGEEEDLGAADLDAEVLIKASRIEGRLYLADSHWNRGLSLEGSVVVGGLVAWRMRSTEYLYLRGATFSEDVFLTGARIAGDLDMGGASFAKNLNADSLTIGGNVFMNRPAAFHGDVNLRDTRVSGQLAMMGASFDKTLDGDNLVVEGDLYMRDGATFRGEVNLRNTKVGGQLSMRGATFFEALIAEFLNVRQALLMDAGARFIKNVDLEFTKLGAFSLSNTDITHLDLANSQVDAELNTAGLRWVCINEKHTEALILWRLGSRGASLPDCYKGDGAPLLILRNVHVGALQDSADAWPPSLDLEGFKYDRIGGTGGEAERDMRSRSAVEWMDWLARDPTYSSQPYVQLSSVLLAAGHRDTAEQIEFAERNRAHEEVCHRGDRLQCIWLTVLGVVIGYGIGLYTFLVLVWVAVFTIIGAGVLAFSANARRYGPLWLLGASLQRLLPLMELSREFKDFFDNPAPPNVWEKRNLNRLQCIFFASLAIVGWALGGFLIAALGGLIPRG